MENKIIRCQDCYNKFVFTVKQQQMYLEKGWQAPIRCPSCRARKKEIWAANEEYNAIMGKCVMRKFSRHGRGYFRKLGR